AVKKGPALWPHTKNLRKFAQMQLFGAEYFFSINAVILLIGSISIAILIQLRTPNREHFTEFEFATTASAQGMIQMDPRSESS
ncbi:MAG: hypothetical protein O3C37_14340, partial [Proteobacteria bacterium]|nr:hypothetical protein [Pseudomonadota bacterium]